jgi:hypothetical protein
VRLGVSREIGDSCGGIAVAKSRFVLDSIEGITIGGKPISEYVKDVEREGAENQPPTPARAPNAFQAYLTKAVNATLAEDPALQGLHKLCRTGVLRNWNAVQPDGFLGDYLWCVGSIQKPFERHAKQYEECQLKLFRDCDPSQIARDARAIRAEWNKCKCDLNRRMLEAVIRTATEIASGWDAWKRDNLLLPPNPESERTEDWWEAFAALDRLPMIGPALAWYLIRNLYGAPFFKPDLHINAIANHFFAGDLEAMASAVRRLWPAVCKDRQYHPVHLGEVDFMLWWYRRKSNDPPSDG